MVRLKILAPLLAALIFCPLLYSDSPARVKSFFTEKEIKEALKGEFLTAAKLNGRGEVYSRGVEMTKPAASSLINISPSDYDMFASDKGFFYMENTPANRALLYRALTDVRALKGMKYYSVSANRFDELVTDSWRTAHSSDYLKGADGNGVPGKTVFHFSLKDNRLGLLNFRAEVISADGYFVMHNVSTGTATKFGMTVFNPGDYKTFMTLIYNKKLKGYFFYSSQFMKVRSDVLSSFDLIKPGSFGNRLRAGSVHFLKTLGIDRTDRLAAFR